MTKHRAFHLVPLAFVSCTTGESEPAASSSDGEASPTPEGEPTGDPERRQIVSTAREPGAALPRGLAHEGPVVEVWLDPRASSALSVDNKGGVRLWPTLPSASSELAKLAPIRVPIREPRSLSFARGVGETFVIAAIDTSQTARVIEVEIDAEGQPGVRERFALAPDDPLLELHVLDGGERLIGLGVDHRLRLYDGQGAVISELREYGFSPWQLRFAGPPEALQIAVVLAGPTRLQPITIAGDKLAKRGEARQLRLDRGPNLNDLALLPSGKFAAVLRRPKAKTGLWVVELHELDTGAVRVAWGEIEGKRRPRMHVLDDDTILLEGPQGDGYRIDLRAAVAMPAPYELPATVELLPPESRSLAPRFELAKAGDVRQVGVVAGLRAGPSGLGLLLDPLYATHHFTLGHTSFGGGAMDLDPSGTQIVTSLGEGKLVITTLADLGEHPTTCTMTELRTVEFSDPDHLLIVGGAKASLCAWRTGEVVSELALPSHVEVAVHVERSGGGALAIRETEDEAWLARSGNDVVPDLRKHASFDANTFGPLEPLAGRELARWPEIDIDDEDKTIALDRAGNVYVRKQIDTRHFHIDPAEGKRRKLTFGERPVDLDMLVPSPEGKQVAIVHSHATDHGPSYYGYGGGYYGGYVSDLRGDTPDTLTLFTIEGDIPQARWSAALTTPDVQLSWSDDGSRLAVEDLGRVRVFDPSGAIVFDRHDRKFSSEQLPDPVAPVVTPDAKPK